MLAARLETDSPGAMSLEMTCLQPSLRSDLALLPKKLHKSQDKTEHKFFDVRQS